MNAQLVLIISIRKNNDTVNSFNKKIKTNEIVVKKINDLVKKFRFQFSIFQFNIATINQLNIQFKFVLLTNRIQRLFNNYQKITSIEKSSIAKIIDKKVSLQNKNNNKISTFATKLRTFKFCRHCDDDHYDNVCFTQTKIMMIEIKKKRKI